MKVLMVEPGKTRRAELLAGGSRRDYSTGLSL